MGNRVSQLLKEKEKESIDQTNTTQVISQKSENSPHFIFPTIQAAECGHEFTIRGTRQRKAWFHLLRSGKKLPSCPYCEFLEVFMKIVSLALLARYMMELYVYDLRVYYPDLFDIPHLVPIGFRNMLYLLNCRIQLIASDLVLDLHKKWDYAYTVWEFLDELKYGVDLEKDFQQQICRFTIETLRVVVRKSNGRSSLVWESMIDDRRLMEEEERRKRRRQQRDWLPML
jgi:hypothetical protein